LIIKILLIGRSFNERFETFARYSEAMRISINGEKAGNLYSSINYIRDEKEIYPHYSGLSPVKPGVYTRTAK
jgi:hypothetical protein